MVVAGLIGLASGGALPATAQPTIFEKAKSAYDFGEYEEAGSLFSQVARDTSVDKTIRQQALRYLGRVHIARDQTQKAREAVENLLQLEPPPVQLDPNREPPPMIELYYEVRKQMRGDYSVRGGPGLKTVAVMDFTNSSVTNTEKWEPLSRGFPSMVIENLRGATDLKVIERQRIQWLLDELELQRKADVVDQSTAVRTGKLLGATAVLFGTYTVLNDRMRLTARLVEVETSKILLSEKIMGEPEEVFALTEDLSKQVTKAINVDLQNSAAKGDSGTKSLDALMEYSDGLEAYENGNWQAARDRFKKALEYDPDYKPAKQKLQSTRVMVAGRE